MGASPLAATIAAMSRDPAAVSPREAKQVYRQARRLGRCDLVPTWLSERARAANEGEQRAEFWACLTAKAVEHDISFPALAEVYRRGVVEYEQMRRSHKPVPIGADRYAQGRVNSFIRMVYGDPMARTDDADLLRLVTDAPRGLR